MKDNEILATKKIKVLHAVKDEAFIQTLQPDTYVNVDHVGLWKNPHSLTLHKRETALKLYENWLDSHPDIVKEIKKRLKGKYLVCGHKSPNYAEILFRIANDTNHSNETEN